MMEKNGEVRPGLTPPETPSAPTTTPPPASEKQAADALDTDVVKRAAQAAEERLRKK